MKTARWVLLIAIGVACATAVSPASACSVPVFRYALERWPASPYEVFVLHRGQLTEDQTKLTGWLRDCAEGAEARSNIEFASLDIAKDADGAYSDVIKKHADGELPKVVVRYPSRYRLPSPVWSGPINAANARMIVDSPARREIGLRILKGHSAVWVLLESGEKKKDDTAAKLVGDELAKLKTALKLPEVLPEDVIDEAEAPDMDIEFSMLRLSRKDPKEKLLVSTLLGAEADLKTYEEPMLFVVIGQGLALPPLIGKGINKENVRGVADFVVGPCSCTVKDQIQGLDLLMSVNWGATADGQWVKPQPPPELAAVPEPNQLSRAQRRRAAPVLADGDTGPFTWSFLQITATVGGIAIVAVLVISIVLARRANSRED